MTVLLLWQKYTFRFGDCKQLPVWICQHVQLIDHQRSQAGQRSVFHHHCGHQDAHKAECRYVWMAKCQGTEAEICLCRNCGWLHLVWSNARPPLARQLFARTIEVCKWGKVDSHKETNYKDDWLMTGTDVTVKQDITTWLAATGHYKLEKPMHG
jgi:hypothetical protein